MKEIRFFYNPDAENRELPEEEAGHAIRVLRLDIGDEIWVMNGKGTFYRCIISEASKKHCLYNIVETLPQPRAWTGNLHLAIAPTKNIDRMEWLVEKATEIGFDELTFLNCTYSERIKVKDERIEKILISAMKQSHKSELPHYNGMVDFKTFMSKHKDCDCQKFICHCWEGEKKLLKNELTEGNIVVMIGPEGDFSQQEVAEANSYGFNSVSLGQSRLRTETAGLVAVHLMHLVNE